MKEESDGRGKPPLPSGSGGKSNGVAQVGPALLHRHGLGQYRAARLQAQGVAAQALTSPSNRTVAGAFWRLGHFALRRQTGGAVPTRPVAVEQGRPHLRASVTFAPAAAW